MPVAISTNLMLIKVPHIKHLKEAVKGLYEAGFAYSKADEATGKIGHYKSRWVDKIGYIDDLGCVELVFASDVIPLITRLEKRFTRVRY